MQVLQGDPDAPADLRQKALRLAARIIEFDPGVRGGAGFDIAREVLDSGQALTTMEKIIDTQGRREHPPQPGSLVKEVCADRSGTVISIDNLQMTRIARLAGAPMDKGAGVDLLKKLGDKVIEGEPLYRVHACFASDFRFADDLSSQSSGYEIGDPKDMLKVFAEF